MKSALIWESSEAPRVLLKGRLQSDLVETSERAVTSKKKQDDLLLVYLTPPCKTPWLKNAFGNTWSQNPIYFVKD